MANHSFLREAERGIERSVDRALLIPQLSPSGQIESPLLINAAIGASAPPSLPLPAGRPLTTRIFQRNWADVPYGGRIGNRESLDSTTADGRLPCNTRLRRNTMALAIVMGPDPRCSRSCRATLPYLTSRERAGGNRRVNELHRYHHEPANCNIYWTPSGEGTRSIQRRRIIRFGSKHSVRD